VQQSGAGGSRAGRADRRKASFAACFTFGGLRYANPPYALGAQEVNCDRCTCPFAAARSPRQAVQSRCENTGHPDVTRWAVECCNARSRRRSPFAQQRLVVHELNSIFHSKGSRRCSAYSVFARPAR
jgi:hypothetical protein